MTTMKAMVYYGENDIRFEDRPIPQIIDATDAVIRITKTTICGTDLGIWKGKNPEIQEEAKKKTGEFNGRILGHEGIGIVEEVGSAVKNVKKAIESLFPASAAAGLVKIVRTNSMLTAVTEVAGLWAT